jgi:hypothetical protein
VVAALPVDHQVDHLVRGRALVDQGSDDPLIITRCRCRPWVCPRRAPDQTPAQATARDRPLSQSSRAFPATHSARPRACGRPADAHSSAAPARRRPGDCRDRPPHIAAGNVPPRSAPAPEPSRAGPASRCARDQHASIAARAASLPSGCRRTITSALIARPRRRPPNDHGCISFRERWARRPIPWPGVCAYGKP